MRARGVPTSVASRVESPRLWRARLRAGVFVLAGSVWTGKTGAAAIALGVWMSTIQGSPRWPLVGSGAFVAACGLGWLLVGRPRPVGVVGVRRASGEDARATTAGYAIVPVWDATVEPARGGARFFVGVPLLLGLGEAELSQLLSRAERARSVGHRADEYLAGLARAYALRARARLDLAPYFWRVPVRLVVPWLARALDGAAERLAQARRVADDEPARMALDAAARVADYLERVYWPAVWSRSDLEQEPPRSVVSDLLAALREESGHAAPAAGEALLGAAGIRELAVELDEQWASAAADEWREAYQNGMPALARLEAAAAEGLLAPDEAYEYATLVERFRGAAQARPLYQRVLEDAPYWPPPNLALGRLLLQEGNEAGLALVERAISTDERVLVYGCELAADYLEQTGRASEARVYRTRAARQIERGEIAVAEREEVSASDDLVPHGLDDDDLLPLVGVLRNHREIDVARLGRKRLQEASESSPVFLLGVLRRSRWWRLEPANYDRTLATALRSEISLPGWTGVIVTASQGEFERWFASLPGSDVYLRRERLRRRRLAIAALVCLVLLYLITRASAAS